MARFQGASPFQVTGFVWANGAGSILAPAGVRLTLTKPTFSFDYDHLYAEPTLAHYVIADEETAFTPEQVAEIQAWITAQLGEPLIVNGVDADGKFLANVPETAVVRTVDFPPPSNGTWRFDFDKAATTPGDHWLQAHCVDADGRYIGNVDEGQWAALATSAPPSGPFDWRWRNGAWANETPVAALKKLRTDEAWGKAMTLLNSSVATITFGDQSFQFGCDAESRENLTGALTEIALERSGLLPAGTVPSPRPWFPKGYTSPLGFTHEQLAAVGAAVLAKKEAFVGAYFIHKAAIDALTEGADVLAYDLTTGWPA